MAISLAQPVVAVAPTSGNVSATLASATTPGNVLLSAYHCNVASLPSTPTGWTLLRSEIAPTNGHAVALYAKVVTGSGDTNFSLNNASASRARCHLFEYSGLDTNLASIVADVKSKEDTSQIANHQFTTANSLSVSNASDPDVLLMAMVALHNNGASNDNWTNSYTQQSTLNGGGAFPASHIAHRIVSASSTYETTMTTGNSRFPIYIHIALRAAGGDPPTGSKTKYKTGGAFIDTTHKYKSGGTFTERTLKYKTGGVFVDV